MDGEGAGPQSPFFPSSAEHQRRRDHPGQLLHDERDLRRGATRTSTTSGTRRCTTSRRSTTSGTGSRSSTCRTSSARSRRSGAPAATTTRCSSTAASTSRSRSRSTRRRRRPASAARRATRSSHVQQHDGPGRLRDRVPAAARPGGERRTRCCSRRTTSCCCLDPEPHRETFLKPFHREQTPEFCSSCHKVHLDVPVNDYRWFRGFNDYDNWQASGVSGEGARSFYYPPKSQKCADCHMPLRRRRTTRRRRTAWSARTASRPPTPRCRSSTATPSSCKRHAGVPEGRRGLGRRLRAGARRRSRRRAGADGRPPAASRGSRARSRSARSR